MENVVIHLMKNIDSIKEEDEDKIEHTEIFQNSINPNDEIKNEKKEKEEREKLIKKLSDNRKSKNKKNINYIIFRKTKA